MTSQTLTPAARKLLARAGANGGYAYRPTYGPMTQLIAAGLAEKIDHPDGTTGMRLTAAGVEAAR